MDRRKDDKIGYPHVLMCVCTENCLLNRPNVRKADCFDSLFLRAKELLIAFVVLRMNIFSMVS